MSNSLTAASAQQCEATSTEYVIQKPCAGSNVMVQISQDDPSAFNFAVEDIRAMRLLSDGGLLIKFMDGSTLTVTNFEAVRESGKFSSLTMSDGTTVDFDKLAQGLASTLPHDTIADLTILKPQGGVEGATSLFSLQEGKTYKLGFDMKDVSSVEQSGDDLVVSFKDGSTLKLENYDSVQAGVLPPQMTLEDGSVVPAAQLINVLNVAVADQVQAVEPAAGDTKVSPKQSGVQHNEIADQATETVQKNADPKKGEDQQQASAEQLAQIEPAAGGAAGPIGGSSGYGFNSSVDAVGVNPLLAVGPIGLTNLQFGLPELQQFTSAPQTAAAPGTPTLSASDRFGFEDTEINLLISATGATPASETLTVTVAGIPAGWGVNIASSGGTFDSATGVWTISLPQGVSYSGGPFLIPPHDFDGDIKSPTNPPLTITMVTTDVGTGAVETVSATMNVTVDAVADQPDLAVTNVSGSDNVPLPLAISAHVVDTDGSEVLTTATLTGIPAGFTLNHGTLSGGVWTVDPADLASLTLTPPHGYDGSFVVTVRVDNAEAFLTDDEVTLSNNTNFNEESFTVTINDTAPIVGDSTAAVDDSDLALGSNVATGNVSINYQLDTPGTFAPQNNFSATGSLLGGALTSNGHAVTVTLAGGTYTAVANGVTVFTLVVQSDGSYTFTQFEQLDHADGSNANDVISLNFTVAATDSDGDTDTGTITIDVRDDAPVAANDAIATGAVATGNVTSNDTLSQDTPNTVTKVTFGGTDYTVPSDGSNLTIGGAFGTLAINNTGAYTYTSKNVGTGTDNFVYTLRDYDGDTSTATLAATINDVDTVPVVNNAGRDVDDTHLSAGPDVVSGFVSADYFADGPGQITPTTTFLADGSLAGGILSSGGSPVAVTLAGNTYTGKDALGNVVFTLQVKTNGAFTFTLFEPLDHADATDPNDMITLKFTVIGTDSDGDTDTGVISIHVYDDGPVAMNDTFLSATSTATGNIMANDNVGQDVPGRVYDATFGGETKALPSDGSNVTFTNASGTLVINTTGQFTYTPPLPGQGATFTYHLIDFDGDQSVVDANHGTVVIDTNGTPTIVGSSVTTDDTALSGGAQTVNGTYTFGYGADGQGAGGITNTGYTGPALTSGGVAVAVTLAGNTYTGKAGAVTVFTMTVNTDGTYSFTQFAPLDHPDTTNPDDALNLTFGVRITDANGDIANGALTAVVRDDGPVAVNDSFLSSTSTATGNIMANDNVGQDVPGRVYDATFGGETKALPSDGSNVTFTNASGTLVINTTGQFTYTPPLPGQGATFTYHLIDFDGDQSVVDANHGTVVIDTDGNPIIGDATVVTDETSLVIGPSVTNGSVSAEFFGDGPGTISALNSFTAGGSLAGGVLTSHGSPVTVTLSGNTYTGKDALNNTVFTLAVHADGSFAFTQFEQLDHANGSDPNDIITLDFAVRATDADGDTDDGKITVNVRDDAPSALNDTVNLASGTATGNVLTNDTPGQDTPVPVVSVTYNGVAHTLPAGGADITIVAAHGTLVINSTGAYTYTSNNSSTGTDAFNYTIRDYDNDTSSATLSVSVTDVDTVPVVSNSAITVDETNLGPITMNGQVNADYFADGPGTIAATGAFTSAGSLAGGALTSHGTAVTVSLSGGTYTGQAGAATVFTLVVNADGSYSYTQFAQLDHADPSDPNDVIRLNFGVLGTDADGDTDTGVITVNVLDDVPVAVNDTLSVNDVTPATGNLLANDTPGHDAPIVLTQIVFNGVTHTVPANGSNTTIHGTYGDLVINNTGAYTYTSNNTAVGSDSFSYTIRDFDQDPATAVFTATVTDIDTTPVVNNVTKSIDESGSHTLTGTVVADFGADGPGIFLTCGAFDATGSLKGGALSSGGVAVSVTNTGHGYVGMAGAETVFTLDINQTTGAYTFTQLKALDHADGSNPDDVISLDFEICAKDADGDVGHGTLTINVIDDAPRAGNDNTIYCAADWAHNGNLITGFHDTGSGADTLSFDTPNWVFSVTGTGGTATIPEDGAAAIKGTYGTLYVFNNGAYFYNQMIAGEHTETFSYSLQDGDGDTSGGSLVITGTSSYVNDTWITVNGSATGTNGGDMMVAYSAGVDDTMFGQGGDDALFGWSGNDNLHGGAGNDALFGEYGADNLWGDAGADIFVAERSDMDGGYLGTFYDTVKDFNAAQGDVIDLSSLIDNGSAAQSAINNYVRAVNQGAGTMLQVNNGSGWHDAMFVDGHTNMDVQTLLNDGNLDVA